MNDLSSGPVGGLRANVAHRACGDAVWAPRGRRILVDHASINYVSGVWIRTMKVLYYYSTSMYVAG